MPTGVIIIFLSILSVTLLMKTEEEIEVEQGKPEDTGDDAETRVEYFFTKFAREVAKNYHDIMGPEVKPEVKFEKLKKVSKLCYMVLKYTLKNWKVFLCQDKGLQYRLGNVTKDIKEVLLSDVKMEDKEAPMKQLLTKVGALILELNIEEILPYHVVRHYPKSFITLDQRIRPYNATEDEQYYY
uniref:Uncharacterized protein n=1 Tax=Clastoptera arizonana TaxID=38151 RepID=A0A1B6ECG7_9HEMI